MLSLYEEFLLLSVHSDRGIIIGSALERINPGLVGAILADLALAGKITATKNHRLHLAETNPTGDPILDDSFAELQKSDKERKFGYWLSELFPKPDKLVKKVTKNLVQKGLVIQEDDNLVWVVPSPLHPEINGSAKYAIIQHLRSIALAKEQATPQEIAFLTLVSASGLLDLLFLRDERKVATQYINELVVGEAMKDPLMETIQEIDSAIANVVEED